ncbi:MAG: ribbon-helix-helix protein, CopG family [Nostoc sp. JL31]|uniref:ribbon-helix-helix protein, CopG family n=1 Tax=Nostoc sp. JL31 TaxID=2815395 RepID=UPI0025D01007|nr:ribbon-helix-helix protein, CopG family [Nostoc sp. JL31]MBN3888764.1 ribbon-helix-helix protein, CopG family [Nostoc sp. JL31]
MGKDKAISIRLSQAMLEALDARAILDEKDRTQLIREAISVYLGLPEDEDTVEDRVSSLERNLSNLSKKIQTTEGKTDSLEMRVNELSRLIAILVERL